jgi:hypothetical protein
LHERGFGDERLVLDPRLVAPEVSAKMSEHAANDSASPPTMSVAAPARTCALLPEIVASR